MNVFDIFKKTTQTYESALKKKESEQTVKKIERFRISEDGEYKVRILPLAPIVTDDGPQDLEREGYEYPVRQQFLTIKTPAKGKKKAGKISIPVVQTTQKGVDLPVDLIDTFVKIAKEYQDDDITEKIKGNSYSGGLKWGFLHAMYVLDCNKNRKGPLLYECSGAQYHAIEDEKFNIWRQLRENRPERPDSCPLCGFTDAYTLNITRSNNNGKTEYKFSINALGKEDNLSETELNSLLSATRIPDEIYRYTRYQFEATLEFLKQYDEMLQTDICNEPDFLEAVEQLKAALPKDDTSHFSLDSADSKSGDKSKSVEVTIDTLWDENDYLEEQGLGKTSDEYQELREKIGQYVQDKNLDIRISHSKSNAQILNEIEELEENNAQTTNKQEPVDEPEPEAAPAKKEDDEPAQPRRKRPARPVDEENEPSNEPEPANEEKSNVEDEEPSRPRRRQRPVEEEPETNAEENTAEENPEPEPAPVRRRRR